MQNLKSALSSNCGKHCVVPSWLQHIKAWKKWRTHCRWHFQMHFPEWKVLHSYSNFTHVCSLGSTDNKSMLIQKVADSLPRSIITQFDAACVARANCTWWSHQMETFSALLAICAGNSPVPGEFPAQRPVTRSLDVFFDLRLNKWLSKQSWGWWFETLSHPLWRHCNDTSTSYTTHNIVN